MTKFTVITLDFETYYDTKQKYQLINKNRGLTIEQYVRDPRFEIIGLAVKVNNRPTEFLAPHEIQGWLDHIAVAYGWDNVCLVAHNARFDCAILGWLYGVYPKQIADTMLMSRAIKRWDVNTLDNLTTQLRVQYNWGAYYTETDTLYCGDVGAVDDEYVLVKGDEVHNADGKHLMDFTDEEYDAYGEYAKTDVDLTYSAYRWFMEHWGYPEKEIDVMTYTIEMFTYPVLELDKAVLLEVQKDIHHKRDSALSKTGLTLADVRSDDKFADALRSLGVEPPTKLNAKGQTKYAFAKTDVAFQKLLDHDNGDVVNLVSARLNNKSSQVVTRVQSFIEMAERGALPIPIEYYAAHTGRWGGCLTADTMVYVRNDTHKYQLWKPIVTVAPDDLVFDGDKFVSHGGVEYRGVQRVMNYLGISGTHSHPILLEDGTYAPLEAVYEDRLPLRTVESTPTVPDGYYHTDIYLHANPIGLEEPVYDLVDCGDLHRFAIKAWGMIYVVHNSDKLNPQNLNRNVLVGSNTLQGQLVFYKGKADRFVKLMPDGKVYLAKHGVVENNEEELHVVGLRDAFKAPKGKQLVVLDLSQIELRMNAYVAGEQWVLDALVAGKDIYKVAASKSFGISYEEVTKTQRYVGKQQELLLGYGGGENAIIRGIGKKAEEFDVAELKSWVTLYRETHPHIKEQWKRRDTVFKCMAQGVVTEVDPRGILQVDGDSILLPNGMRIVYRGIKVERGSNGYNEIYFWGKNKVTGKPDWEKTFGGKGVENDIQALSRIVLSDAMFAMREEFAKRGWSKEQVHIVMQVHDEVIVCCDEELAEEVYAIMEDCLTRVPYWAKGLPLACDGDIAKRYGCAK